MGMSKNVTLRGSVELISHCTKSWFYWSINILDDALQLYHFYFFYFNFIPNSLRHFQVCSSTVLNLSSFFVQASWNALAEIVCPECVTPCFETDVSQRYKNVTSIYKTMSQYQTTLLSAHVILYVFLILLPFTSSDKFGVRYGAYLSWFMSAVIASWLVFGKCVLGDLEGREHDESGEERGSIVEFSQRVLHIKTGECAANRISLITTLMYCYAAYHFAAYNSHHQQLVIILTALLLIQQASDD